MTRSDNRGRRASGCSRAGPATRRPRGKPVPRRRSRCRRARPRTPPRRRRARRRRRSGRPRRRRCWHPCTAARHTRAGRRGRRGESSAGCRSRAARSDGCRTKGGRTACRRSTGRLPRPPTSSCRITWRSRSSSACGKAAVADDVAEHGDEARRIGREAAHVVRGVVLVGVRVDVGAEPLGVVG